MKQARVLAAFLLLLIASPAITDECYSYPGTRVQYFSQCACYACAYTGSGCTACTNGSDTCYTDAATCGPLNPMP
jgi:hypothetical protein